MNYLAHAYLSFGVPHLLVGNMISDFVKGGQKSGHAASVQQGIELHRAIDAFTDAHPATADAKQVFRSRYRLYSGPIVDVLFDYFLANDEEEFPAGSLHPFTETVYQTLERETAHLPSSFQHVFTHMRLHNWLYHYRTPEGIGRSLHGLSRRASQMGESETAFALFLSHADHLQACYRAVFPAVKQMAKEKIAAFNA